jgi:rhodanese-related sulfurtransferase
VNNFIVFMGQEWMLFGMLILLGYVFLWRERVKSGTPVSAHEVTRLVNAEAAVLLDVRDAAEFKAGHIVGAINIPYAKISADPGQLEPHRSKIIVVVDKMGQHAGTVGRNLARQGYQVRRLSGGIAEWQAQSLPLVK